MTRTVLVPAKWPWVLWLGYCAFVIYGSLVPFRFKARPLADAWVAFQNIPYRQLAVDSRADWIANGVLYVPLSFLTALVLTQFATRIPRVLGYVMAAGFSLVLAVTIEFVQLFFPQRTVSLNDIYAEWVGSALGLALLAFFGNWLRKVLPSLWSDRGQLEKRALQAYAVFYIAFSLFPFDILLSKAELQAKIQSGSWGWILANSDVGLFRAGLQILIEIVLTLPLGFLCIRQMRIASGGYAKAVILGLLLGFFIEVAQFFTATGISQGLSVLTRSLSFCVALGIGTHQGIWNLAQARRLFKRYAPALLAVYVPTLLAVNGWFGFRWQGGPDALAQLGTVQFMPFYYHYFTSEANALQSLASVCLSYLPLAIVLWAHYQSPKQASIVCLLLAAGIETSKLFHVGNHPDPTNILLAAVAAWMVVRVLNSFSSVLPVQASPPLDRPALSEPVAVEPPSAQGVGKQTAFLMLLAAYLIAIGVWLVGFPVYSWLVGLVLTACAAAVWYRPVLAFAIIPGAMPVFDLAPWSGRFYFDEFDALLLLIFVIGIGRTTTSSSKTHRSDVRFSLLFGLVLLSFFASAIRGLWPLQWPDTNAFSNYYSAYNALRIGKGALQAYLLWVLLKRFDPHREDVRRYFSSGMVVGLGFTVAVVLWERLAFGQLLDFSTDYRVTGPFSAMHTGGAYIECFIAVATAFLAGQLLLHRTWIASLWRVPLLVGATYAVMVTFSRNGYAAFAAGIGAVLLLTTIRSHKWLQNSAVGLGLVAIALLVATPIYKGDFAQSRMATVTADLGVREAHWREALSLRDSAWATTLLGQGLGRYPETSYWNSVALPKPGTYSVQTEAGNRYLRLGGGDPLYVEQIVPIVAGQTYVLKLDIRTDKPDSKFAVPICQKWMLTSSACVVATFNLGPEIGQWRSYTMALNFKDFGTSPWYAQRTSKLSLTNNANKSIIEVDNLRLENSEGQNILVNGNFAQGLDRWFTAVDSHLQWHIKSMPVALVFDQGWFGLVAVLLLLALILGRTVKHVKHGDPMPGIILAALLSFLVTGAFDTLIDNPRFLWLFLFLCCLCGNRFDQRLKPKPSKFTAKSAPSVRHAVTSLISA